MIKLYNSVKTTLLGTFTERIEKNATQIGKYLQLSIKKVRKCRLSDDIKKFISHCKKTLQRSYKLRSRNPNKNVLQVFLQQ